MTNASPHETPDALIGSGRTERDAIVAQILNAIQTIDYGSIEITIHDSAVVQIERTEKIRFDRRKTTTTTK